VVIGKDNIAEILRRSAPYGSRWIFLKETIMLLSKCVTIAVLASSAIVARSRNLSIERLNLT